MPLPRTRRPRPLLPPAGGPGLVACTGLPSGGCMAAASHLRCAFQVQRHLGLYLGCTGFAPAGGSNGRGRL
eukprot:3021035-Lingulodinium_polyedra.AAC.1